MKTVFDESTRRELINRINLLNEQCIAQWGKMNVNQMTRHCALWDDMVLQNKKYKRVFIGRLLGKVFLKNELKNDRPMRPHNPTVPELVVNTKDINLESEKSKWISLLKEYEKYNLPDYTFVHPFFGKMTKEQIGYHSYKHTDHHLRQFGC